MNAMTNGGTSTSVGQNPPADEKMELCKEEEEQQKPVDDVDGRSSSADGGGGDEVKNNVSSTDVISLNRADAEEPSEKKGISLDSGKRLAEEEAKEDLSVKKPRTEERVESGPSLPEKDEGGSNGESSPSPVSARKQGDDDDAEEKGEKEKGDGGEKVARPVKDEATIQEEAEFKERKRKLREGVKRILNRQYKDLTKKEFEDLLVVSMMDYFRHYNPTIQLQHKVVTLEKLLIKLQENYNRTVKQLFEAKYLIKRMMDMKKENPTAEMEIPFKLMRSVAVQVQSSRCRGGDLCPGTPSLPKVIKEVVNGDKPIKRSSRKSTTQLKNRNIEQKAPVDKAERRSSVGSEESAPTVNGHVSSVFKPLGPPPVLKKVPLAAPVAPPTPPPPQPTPVAAAPSPVAAAVTSPAAVAKGAPPAKAAETPVVIDLTDKDGPAETSKPADETALKPSTSSNSNPLAVKKVAPSPLAACPKVVSIEKVQLPSLPTAPKYPPLTVRPPQPVLKVNKADQSGIMLSWTLKSASASVISEIASYQVYACQENSGVAREWSPVGDVRALPLPMACTLSQFREGHRYHFVVRAVDKQRTLGDFSHPASILLVKGVVPR